MNAQGLEELQRWLYDRVLHPPPAEPESASAGVVISHLTEADRVEVQEASRLEYPRE